MALVTPSSVKERIKAYTEAIETSKIDFDQIRKLAFTGIPDQSGLRAKYWKILLNYLPLNKEDWATSLESSRQTYLQFSEELIANPYKNLTLGSNATFKVASRDVTMEDHPLNTAHDSQWNAHFKDLVIMQEIEKDVKRTCPSLHFFTMDLYAEEEKNKTIKKKPFDDVKDPIELFKKYSDTISKTNPAKPNPLEAIQRILFMYTKLNSGIGYVQGMNEILGPIYYTFASDNDPFWRDYAEADGFFCFMNLMSEIRDNFVKTLDATECGIGAHMDHLNDLLRRKDKDLWDSLTKKNMQSPFYSFRWITLLLTQEFELPDVQQIWDSFFGDPDRFSFVIYFCCAMMENIREELLKGDFADNLKLLQNYPMNSDVGQIMNIAIQIKEEDKSGKLKDIAPVVQTSSVKPSKKETNTEDIQQLIKNSEKKNAKNQIRKPSVYRGKYEMKEKKFDTSSLPSLFS